MTLYIIETCFKGTVLNKRFLVYKPRKRIMCPKLRDYHVRCNADEHQLVKTVSGSIGLTLSEFVRGAIRKELQSYGFHIDEAEEESRLSDL